MLPHNQTEGREQNGNHIPDRTSEVPPPPKPAHEIGSIRIFIGKSAGHVVPTGEKGMEANEPEPVFSDADINVGRFPGAAFHPHSGDRLDSPLLTYDVELQQYVKEEEERVWPTTEKDIRFGDGGGWGEPLNADREERRRIKRTVLPRIGDGKPHTAQELYHCLGHWLRSPWSANVLPWHPQGTEENVENGA